MHFQSIWRHNFESVPARRQPWWCLCEFHLCTGLPKKILDTSLMRDESWLIQQLTKYNILPKIKATKTVGTRNLDQICQIFNQLSNISKQQLRVIDQRRKKYSIQGLVVCYSRVFTNYIKLLHTPKKLSTMNFSYTLAYIFRMLGFS